MDKKYKALRTIYLVMTMMVIFAFINIVGIDKVLNFSDFSNILIYVYALCFIGLSEILYRFNLKGKKIKPEEKFTSGHYQTSSLMRWAVIEGGIFLGIFSLSDYYFSSFILIFYLLLLFPQKHKFEAFLDKKRDNKANNTYNK